MPPLKSSLLMDLPQWIIEVPHGADIPALLRFSTRCAIEAQQQQIQLPLTEQVWETLIHAGDVVCAKHAEGRIAGYYAANQLKPVADVPALEAARAAKNILCNRFKYPEPMVAFGAVAALDVRTQDSDLRLRLLRDLLRSVGYRYRCLFNVVDKSNAVELSASREEGWRCFHEEDDACYMMLDVAKTLRQLASAMVLRMPIASKPARVASI